MGVGATNVQRLKNAITDRFTNQLLRLQLGHPYKRNDIMQDAIDLVEYLESCGDCEKATSIINNMINKLYADFDK